MKKQIEDFFFLPNLAPKGLSQIERDSLVSSSSMNFETLQQGNIVDFPYYAVQHLFLNIFGLNFFSIKLPTILFAIATGVFIIILLNRHFKNVIALITAIMSLFSVAMLFVSTNGSPLIMYPFWLSLIIWLGSKLINQKKPNIILAVCFVAALIFSLYTPYMIYFAVFCVIFVLVQPHLRFVVKGLPKLPLSIVGIIVLAGFVVLGISIFHHPETIMELLFTKDFRMGEFFGNIAAGLAPMFSWHHSLESVFLAPLISLPTFALALIGLFSTTKGFFASRNSIASILIVFCLIITGFNPQAVVFFILPFSILVAHGLKYLLEKWYGLFPQNPYARVSAALPLIILFGFMIIPGLLQYIYGYRYNPNIATEFSDKLAVVCENLTDEYLLVNENYAFYKILEAKSDIKVVNEIEKVDKLAVLGQLDDKPEEYGLAQIITSPMRDNSDIIYLYTYTEKVEGE